LELTTPQIPAPNLPSFADLVITNPWKKAGAFREYFHYVKIFKNGSHVNDLIFGSKSIAHSKAMNTKKETRTAISGF